MREPELLLNPTLAVSGERFSAAVRGGEAKHGYIDGARFPELLRFLRLAATEKKWTEELKLLALPHFPELLRLHVLVEASECPKPVRFTDFFDAGSAEQFMRLEIWPEGHPELAAARRALAEDQYSVRRGLLSKSQLEALRSYYRGLREEGFFLVDREQAVEQRSYLHNEPIARLLQQEMLPWVVAVSGERSKPSYTFTASYYPGAELLRHVDREQCAWNVSLLLDDDNRGDLRAAWPLCFEVQRQVREARLAPGDAVIYRGTRTPHWRPPLASKNEVLVLLGHYVPENFEGSLI